MNTIELARALRLEHLPLWFVQCHFVYKTVLKARYGLSDGLIERLGASDHQIRNEHGGMSKLYDVARIERILEENWEEYVALLGRRRKREDDPSIVEERDSVILAAKNVEIVFLPIPHNLNEAIIKWRIEQDKSLDPALASRISMHDEIRFIRDNYTDYYLVFSKLNTKKAGALEAGLVLRRRYLNAIIALHYHEAQREIMTPFMGCSGPEYDDDDVNRNMEDQDDGSNKQKLILRARD